MENFTGPERETVVRWDDESPVVHIWTAQRAVITKLSRNPSFTLESSGTYGSSPWAEFTIPTEKWTFGSKRATSPETRAKLRERAKTQGLGRAS